MQQAEGTPKLFIMHVPVTSIHDDVQTCIQNVKNRNSKSITTEWPLALLVIEISEKLYLNANCTTWTDSTVVPATCSHHHYCLKLQVDNLNKSCVTMTVTAGDQWPWPGATTVSSYCALPPFRNLEGPPTLKGSQWRAGGEAWSLTGVSLKLQRGMLKGASRVQWRAEPDWGVTAGTRRGKGVNFSVTRVVINYPWPWPWPWGVSEGGQQRGELEASLGGVSMTEGAVTGASFKGELEGQRCKLEEGRGAILKGRGAILKGRGAILPQCEQ